MRIITGKYKGRHFDIPRTFKARPTTDFAKENLFNVIRAYLDFEGAHALDLFGGTGSITFELLSRGCERVVCIEKDSQHFRFIHTCLDSLKDSHAELLRGDAFRFLSRCHEQFDFIFADPPYALPDLEKIPELVLNTEILAPEGLFVLEHGKTNDFSNNPRCVEHRVYGSVNFSFFQ